MFRKLGFVLLTIAFAAVSSFADSVTATASGGGSNSTTSYWQEATYSLSSSVSSSSMTGGQTGSSSPYSATITYSPLPANVSITSATLTFNAVGTETQAQSAISSVGAIDPGYYYSVEYSYSCGWSTCYGYDTYYQSYGYSAGTMSTSGYETGFLSQIQSGSMTQNVAPASNGSIDLLALGFGSSLLNNSSLTFSGTTNQFQSDLFMSPGYNSWTDFTNTSSGTADITATLDIVYQQNPSDPPPSPSPTPEPASLALMVSGLGAALLKRRSR